MVDYKGTLQDLDSVEAPTPPPRLYRPSSRASITSETSLLSTSQVLSESEQGSPIPPRRTHRKNSLRSNLSESSLVNAYIGIPEDEEIPMVLPRGQRGGSVTSDDSLIYPYLNISGEEAPTPPPRFKRPSSRASNISNMSESSQMGMFN